MSDIDGKNIYQQLAELNRIEQDKLTEENRKKFRVLLVDVVGDVARNGHNLSADEYKEVMTAISINFAGEYKAVMKQLIKLEQAQGTNFKYDFENKLLEQGKKLTQSNQGKNNIPTIFNVLGSIAKKKDENITKADRNRVQVHIMELSTEMRQRRVMLNKTQKGCLKEIYERFPEEVDAAFGRVKNPMPEFVETYNEMTGKNVPIPVKITKDEVNELANTLRNVSENIDRELDSEKEMVARQKAEEEKKKKEEEEHQKAEEEQKKKEEEERQKAAEEERKKKEEEERQKAAEEEQKKKEEEERKKGAAAILNDENDEKAAEDARKKAEENEFARQWDAKSAKGYFVSYLNETNDILLTAEQIGILNGILNAKPKGESLEESLQNNLGAEFGDELKNKILRLAKYGDEIEAEKKTARWSRISYVSVTNDDGEKEIQPVWVGKALDMETFTPKDYIEDNIKNNAIIQRFILPEQEAELLKINEEIARKTEAGLTSDPLRIQFDVAMANSSVELSPTLRRAILFCVGNAEGIDLERKVQKEKHEEHGTECDVAGIISNLDSSNTRKAYLDEIKPWIRTGALKSALALKEPTKPDGKYDACATALTNPDWLLALQETFANNPDKLTDKPKPLSEENKEALKADVDATIIARLRMLRQGDINPSNAFAWLYLVRGGGIDKELAEKIENMIAQALDTYDKEHFGGKDADTYLKDYEAAQNELNSYLKDNAENVMKGYTFTDDDGKDVGEKETKKIKDDILSVAAELVAEDFAKNGMPTGTGKQRKEAIDAAIKAKVDELTLGQKNPSRAEVIGALGANMAGIDNLRARIGAKFKGSKLYEKVDSYFTKKDKHFTERYGKKYIMAKKVVKMATKIGWGVAKSTAMFAAVTAVAPGVGPAALIAYNAHKQWKSIKAQLADQSLSKGEKAAIIASATISGGILAAGMASGVGNVLEQFGVTTPEFLQQAGNIMSSIGGKSARLGAMMLGNSLPNIVKGFSLNREIKKVNKQIEEQKKKLNKGDFSETSQKDMLAEMKELMEKVANLEKLRVANKNKGIEKVITAGVGGALGMVANAYASPYVAGAVGGLLHGQLASDVPVMASTEQAPATPAEQMGDKPQLNQFAQALQDSLNEQQEVINNAFSHTPFGANGEPNNLGAEGTPAATTTQTTEATTSEIPVLTPEQVHAQNFAAAQVESSSGHGAMSAHNDTIRHLGTLGDARIADVNDMAQHLSEHLSDKSNMAVIACKMEPTAVYEALGLSGTDTPMTTYALIDHLANHDLTPAQQQNLDAVLQDKFSDWYNGAQTHGLYATQETTHVSSGAAAEGKSSASGAEATAKTTEGAAGNDGAAAAATTKTTEGVAGNDGVAAAATTKTTEGAAGNDAAAAAAATKTTEGAAGNDAAAAAATAEANGSIKFEAVSKEDAARLGLDQHPQDGNSANQGQASQQQQNQSAKHATMEVRQNGGQSSETHTNTQHATDAVMPIIEGSAEWAERRGYHYDPYLSQGINLWGTCNAYGEYTHHGYVGAFLNPENGRVMIIPKDPLHDGYDEHTYSVGEIKSAMAHDRGAYAESNVAYGMSGVVYGSGAIHPSASTFDKVMYNIASGMAKVNAVIGLGHYGASTIDHANAEIKHTSDAVRDLGRVIRGKY